MRARAHTHTHTHTHTRMYLCGWAVCVLEHAHIFFSRICTHVILRIWTHMFFWYLQGGEVFEIFESAHRYAHVFTHIWVICIFEYAHMCFFQCAHVCFFGIPRVVRSLKYLNLHIDMLMYLHTSELFISSNMHIYVFLVSPGCWGLFDMWIST